LSPGHALHKQQRAAAAAAVQQAAASAHASTPLAAQLAPGLRTLVEEEGHETPGGGGGGGGGSGGASMGGPCNHVPFKQSPVRGGVRFLPTVRKHPTASPQSAPVGTPKGKVAPVERGRKKEGSFVTPTGTSQPTKGATTERAFPGLAP
jgi:hypothetical protein